MLLSLRRLKMLLKKEDAENTCLLVARTVDMALERPSCWKSDSFVSGVGGQEGICSRDGNLGESLGCEGMPPKKL